jgi:hypothetical protein
LYETIKQATRRLLEEVRTTHRALSLVLKWAGVALLEIAGVLALYLRVGWLGELAAGAAYP